MIFASRHTQNVARSTPGFFCKAILGLSLSVTVFSVQADLYEDGLMAYAVGNYVKAGQHFMGAADAGNDGAEHMLMRLFAENKLYAEDIQSETLKWTRKAAEKGVVHAQLSLGNIYFAEKQNDAKAAIEWYRKAAEQGHPDAYYQLGVVFSKGAKGVSANTQESRRLYQVAASEFDVYAQKGNADAQYKLAGMYQQGLGMKINMMLAVKWMEKSALQGHMLAQLSLGRLYAEGTGVPHDIRQAQYWLSLAAAQGAQDAVVALNNLKVDEDTKVALIM